MILKIILFPITLPIYIIKKLYAKTFLRSLTINKIDTLSGTEWEQVCKIIFEYAKYNTQETKASSDFGADLILTKKLKIAVQCKLYYNHGVGAKAVQEVTSGAKYYNCDMAVVITNWKYTAQAKSIAQIQNVILLDRQDIITFLSDVKAGTKHSRVFSLVKQYTATIKNIA